MFKRGSRGQSPQLVRVIGAGALVVGVVAMVAHGCQPRIHPGPLNLVVVFIDTIRADHLGCYGHSRPTSPNIDRLAARGTRFGNAISQSSWTLPSAASLLTGLYPCRHQVIRKVARLPGWRETLAEVLRARGYRTAAVVSHSLVSSDHHLDQGFDFFDESNVTGHTGISSPGVTAVALEWLRSNEHRPFFLFLHYFDPHFLYLEHEGFEFENPYRGFVKPEADFRTIQAQRRSLGFRGMLCLRAQYDSEIAFTDHHVGLVLDEIERLGLGESTFLVVTGDHGEEFMEHGWLGHTVHLYEETIHVPLVLYHPALGRMPETFDAPVELVDLMPTVLEMLGVDWDAGPIDGLSFLGALEGKAPPDSAVFSEVCYEDVTALRDPNRTRSRNPNVRSLRMGPWKLVYDVNGERWELYDLDSDPGETRNLGADPAARRFGDMKRRLSEWMKGQERLALTENAVPDTIPLMDRETEERLRALGYVQ